MRPSGPYTILELTGELGIAGAPELRERIRALLTTTTARCVIADLSAVTSCDASGLAVLVGGYRRAHRLGIVLVLAAPRPQVAQVLHASGLDHVLAVFDDAAVAAGRTAA